MTHRPPPPHSAIGKLDDHAGRAARALEKANLQLVLAESCTAGLVASVLGGIPGISRFLCGSAVVYQAETKTAWLDVPQELIVRLGTVAPEISQLLARNILDRTPQADLAAAVTGHLGPNAPTELDGMVYVAIQFRDSTVKIGDCQLPSGGGEANVVRRDRQRLATAFVLDQITSACARKLKDRPRENRSPG